MLLLGEGCGGKKMVASGARWQVACIVGAMIMWIMSWFRNVSRPLVLAMRTNFTGHLAGERFTVASYACLCAGTKSMCPAGMRIRVIMLTCPLMALEF